MSLREVSRRSGVSPTTIVSIEKGHHSPSIETVEWVLAAMGFDATITITEREYKEDDDTDIRGRYQTR